MQDEELPRRPGRPVRPVTRDHLLRVARDAFSQLGYAGASMGDIATRSGIRKSSLFHHFPTKDELYKEALAGVVSDLGARVVETMQGEEPFLVRMDKGTEAIQRYFGQNPVAARLLMREFVDGGAALSAAGDAIDGLLRATVSILESAMDDGIIPRQDPKQLALTLVGVHFLFFAMPEVSSRFVGGDVFGADQIDVRAKVVCVQLRRLMNAPPA